MAGDRRSGARGGVSRGSFLAIVIGMITVALAYFTQQDGGAGGTVPEAETVAAIYVLCSDPPHRNCVIDGDTFYAGNRSIRIADIDAPETDGPECAREGELGREATRRLVTLLNQGPVVLRPWQDENLDENDRFLRVVEREGQSLGMILVAEGLAYEWGLGDRSWCR